MAASINELFSPLPADDWQLLEELLSRAPEQADTHIDQTKQPSCSSGFPPPQPQYGEPESATRGPGQVRFEKNCHTEGEDQSTSHGNLPGISSRPCVRRKLHLRPKEAADGQPIPEEEMLTQARALGTFLARLNLPKPLPVPAFMEEYSGSSDDEGNHNVEGKNGDTSEQAGERDIDHLTAKMHRDAMYQMEQLTLQPMDPDIARSMSKMTINPHGGTKRSQKQSAVTDIDSDEMIEINKDTKARKPQRSATTQRPAGMRSASAKRQAADSQPAAATMDHASLARHQQPGPTKDVPMGVFLLTSALHQKKPSATPASPPEWPGSALSGPSTVLTPLPSPEPLDSPRQAQVALSSPQRSAGSWPSSPLAPGLPSLPATPGFRIVGPAVPPHAPPALASSSRNASVACSSGGGRHMHGPAHAAATVQICGRQVQGRHASPGERGQSLSDEEDTLDGKEGSCTEGEVSTLSFKLIEAGGYFDMPIREAARCLNVGLTSLKRLCREHHIPRWPYRFRNSSNLLVKQSTSMFKRSDRVEDLLVTAPSTPRVKSTTVKRRTAIRKPTNTGRVEKAAIVTRRQSASHQTGVDDRQIERSPR